MRATARVEQLIVNANAAWKHGDQREKVYTAFPTTTNCNPHRVACRRCVTSQSKEFGASTENAQNGTFVADRRQARPCVKFENEATGGCARAGRGVRGHRGVLAPSSASPAARLRRGHRQPARRCARTSALFASPPRGHHRGWVHTLYASLAHTHTCT